ACRRLRRAVSLALGAAGLAITTSALGSALSTVKLQELVRVRTGEPLSAKINVTPLLDRVGKSPGGSYVTVVTAPVLVIDVPAGVPLTTSLIEFVSTAAVP